MAEGRVRAGFLTRIVSSRRLDGLKLFQPHDASGAANCETAARGGRLFWAPFAACWRSCHPSRRMTAVRGSRFLVACLGLALGVLPIAPPEHVHEHEESGHAHLLIHRHAAPHESLVHQTQQGPEIGDHDEPILTLDSPYYAPVRVAFGPPELLASERLDYPLSPRITGAAPDRSVLIHGPPRASTGLRAPPSIPTA